MGQLPETWTIAEIEQLLVPLDNGKCLQQGWSPQCDSEPAKSGDWGVLKTTAIQDGVFLTEHNKRLPIHLQPRQNIEVRVKDILMTCAGPRSRCGVVCLVKHEVSRLMMSGKMYRF
ncbi:MAG: hypothetical protein L6Q40_02050, partial [Azonexus sp.]|nr:hypothetical protein [Azonexus sp.]